MSKITCCQKEFEVEVEYLQHLLIDPRHYFPLFRAQKIVEEVFEKEKIM